MQAPYYNFHHSRFRRLLLWTAALTLIVTTLFTQRIGQYQPLSPPVANNLTSSLENLPLSFIPNAGQTDSLVSFLAHQAKGTLFFTPEEVVISLPTGTDRATNTDGLGGLQPPHLQQAESKSVIRLRFDGSNPATNILGDSQLPGVVNYFTGSPTEWKTKIPTYSSVVYQELYSGIDLLYEGNEGQLKGTYTLASGADPMDIRWHYEGAESARVDEVTGDLVITLRSGLDDKELVTIVERAPTAWQDMNGQRTPVQVRYTVDGDNRFGFQVAEYDPHHTLVIDPTITYSTYFGGNGYDIGWGIAVDSSKNTYITGWTESTDFPGQGYQNTAPYRDAFVTKISANGGGILFSSYFGGNFNDEGKSIAVDNAGGAYITGSTNSDSLFPVFPVNAIQTAPGGGSDAFVAHFNSNGDIIYSTYFGGSDYDEGKDIAIDSFGNAFITGNTRSINFATVNAFQPTFGGGNLDAFVAKINATGTGVFYSSYLGGSHDELTNGSYAASGDIAIDALGSAYVTGSTLSSDFPTVNAFQSTNNTASGSDVFVTKINPSGDALLYSTYLGGVNNDVGTDIAVDSTGSAYITGSTASTDFPIFNAFQSTRQAIDDVFVTKLSSSGTSLVYSTYLGGNGGDFATGLKVDGSGNAYIGGYTYSSNFPILHPIQSSKGGDYDAFMTKLSANGASLVVSTYIGGSGGDYAYDIAVDDTGDAYLTGGTLSSNFPLVSPLQGDASGWDVFIVKISNLVPPPTNTPTATPSSTNTPTPISTMTNMPTSTQSAPSATSSPSPAPTQQTNSTVLNVSVTTLDEPSGFEGDKALRIEVLSSGVPVSNATIRRGGSSSVLGSTNSKGVLLTTYDVQQYPQEGNFTSSFVARLPNGTEVNSTFSYSVSRVTFAPDETLTEDSARLIGLSMLIRSQMGKLPEPDAESGRTLIPLGFLVNAVSFISLLVDIAEVSSTYDPQAGDIVQQSIYRYDTAQSGESELYRYVLLVKRNERIIYSGSIFSSRINDLPRMTFTLALGHLASPADLFLVDPQGRVIGIEPSTGQSVNQIPEAYYVGPNTEPELIVIFEPVPGNYRVTATGTGTGIIHLDVGGITASGTAVLTSRVLQITPGQQVTERFSTSSLKEVYLPLVRR
jgi:hypothetical protein